MERGFENEFVMESDCGMGASESGNTVVGS